MRALVLLAVATACIGMLAVGEVQGVGQTMLGDIIHEFGLKVSQGLHRDTTVAISPLSISSLLSLLMMGTAGQSNLELRRALRYPNTFREEAVHLAYQRLFQSLSRNGPDVTLRIANGLFIQTGTNTEQEFLLNALAYYNSVVSKHNFLNNSHEATQSINDWVKASTSGMIPRLFDQPLRPSTTFVAVNTVFFDGKWQKPFELSKTTERYFNTGNGKIKVPMMSDNIPIDYVVIPELNAHMAAIPYKGGRQAMFIILPEGRSITSNLESLERELTAERMNALIKKMVNTEMRVFMPRMRLSFKAALKDPLTNLQLGSIFDPETANFARLSPDPLFLNDIVHETVIEITEQGTKAAAASGSSLDRVGSSRVFVVDRPAIISIRDIESGIPLFWAKLVKPDPIWDEGFKAADAATPSRPVTASVPGSGDSATPSRPGTDIVFGDVDAAMPSRPVTGLGLGADDAATPSRPVTDVGLRDPDAAPPSSPVTDVASSAAVPGRPFTGIVFGAVAALRPVMGRQPNRIVFA